MASLHLYKWACSWGQGG